jgi:large subunit ribosomal protein L13
MRTFIASAKSADSRWHVIDAKGQVLGRVATLAARLLQGKHKPTYTPFIDTGDHVVVVNAGSVKLTGQKESQKLYRRHSGFEGGLREERAVDVRKRQPIRLVEEAIRGMLPKTKMGDAMYRKLKVYAGAEHPHSASNPQKSRSRNFAEYRVLRNRPPEDIDRPRVSSPRNRGHHRQPPRVRKLLPHRRPARPGEASPAGDRNR